MANPFRWVTRLFSGSEKAPPKRSSRVVKAGYDAAQTTDENWKHWANSDNLSANAAHSPSVRKALRERARYECDNNGYAGGLVESIANDLVGTGPRPQITIPGIAPEVARIIERRWAAWSLASDFAEDLRIMHKTYLRDGECFAVVVDNPRLLSSERTRVSLDLRLYESEQVSDPWDFGLNPLYTDGIRTDDQGNPIEYTFLKHHPGGVFPFPSWDTERLPGEVVIHWYKPNRPGQVRGVPVIAAGLPLYAQLRRYTLATIGAAELAAMMAGVMQTDTPAEEGGIEVESMDAVELVRNALLTLPAGWSASQFKPEQPVSTYKEFKGEILTEIGRGAQTPFNVIAGNSSGYNYSSGRLDHLMYHRALRVDRGRMQRRILDRLFVAWVQEAALAGEIPGSMPPIADWSWEWHWDGFDSIDPQKDAQTDEIELRNHTTTLAQIYGRKGLDWEEQLRQRAREIALQQELGLTTAQTLPAPSPAPAEEEVANAES